MTIFFINLTETSKFFDSSVHLITWYYDKVFICTYILLTNHERLKGKLLPHSTAINVKPRVQF